MSEKYLTLLVVPHDERNVRRARLSYRSLKIVAAVLAVIAVLGLAALATYGRVAARATRVALLERENARLQEENRKVERIAENLTRSEQAYEQIRTMAGLPASNPGRVREPGGVRPREVRAAEPTASEAVDEASNGEGAEPAPRATGYASERPSAWPLTIQGFVTAEYTGKSAHPGIDIAVPPDTPVVATARGVVKQTGFDPVYGHFVVLEHEGDLETMYAHNELLLVERDSSVERGETIAYSGNSGKSTAPHLHYEVRESGWPVDPRPYLP